MDKPAFVLMIQGEVNPAKCARLALLAAGCRIDAASWLRLIAVTADVPATKVPIGFLVATLADLQRLCELGKFVIYSIDNGVLAACTQAEWETRQHGQSK